EGLRNLRSRQNELRNQAAHLEKRHAELDGRVQLAAKEEFDLSYRKEQYTQEVAQLAAQLAEIEHQVGPAEHRVRVLEAEVSRVEGEQSALQEALLEGDTQYSRSAVEKQRCLGTLGSLRIEITE